MVSIQVGCQGGGGIFMSLVFLEALASLEMVMSVTESVCLSESLSVTLFVFGKENKVRVRVKFE